MLMSLIQALALDSSFFVQLALFVLMYPILAGGLFKPYMALYNQREAHTLGKIKQAQLLEQKAQALQAQYEEKVRQVNDEFQRRYKSQKQELETRYLQKSNIHRQALRDKHQKDIQLLEQEIKQARTQTSHIAQQLKEVVFNVLVEKELK